MAISPDSFEIFREMNFKLMPSITHLFSSIFKKLTKISLENDSGIALVNN
tara:strand:- start:335 stop:484 length:150 start_codon:yes stop_codon:yes gene_type:complete